MLLKPQSNAGGVHFSGSHFRGILHQFDALGVKFHLIVEFVDQFERLEISSGLFVVHTFVMALKIARARCSAVALT